MKKKRVKKTFADLTINDSANAPKPVTRPSKKVSTKPPNIIVDPDDLLMEPDDTGNVSVEVVPALPDVPAYRHILPEIWIMISREIRPEDVATFAAICRTTYDITRRAHFWFHLYKKFGPKLQQFGGITSNLPMRLRPESMVRLGGLRACVIRTLFYTYRPFVARFESLNRNLDLTSFTNRRLKVRQFWSVQLKEKLWCYFFKFQTPGIDFQTRNSTNSDRLRNVLENPDEGCRILQIETPKFIPFPQTFDQPQQIYLKTVTYNMSQGLRSYKVTLELITYNGAAFAKLVLDPATNIKVWEWWHPAYHLAKDSVQDYVPVQEDIYFNWM